MPFTLTYDRSPEIFRAILSSLAFSDQLNLRLVSQSFRADMDMVFSEHIILTPDGTSASVQGLVHRVPRLPTLYPNSGNAVLNSTQTVDVRGFFPSSCNLALLKDTFPALSVLRMTTSRGRTQSYTPYIPFPASTLVLFTNPNGFDCNPRYRKGSLQMALKDVRPQICPDGVLGKLPEAVKKIVVNMNGDDVPVADMWSGVFDAPAHVEEIVIVIPRYVSLEDDGSLETFNEPIVAMDLADLIAGVPHGLVAHNPGGPRVPKNKFTIVGLEAVPSGPVPEYSSHYHEQFRAVLREHISANHFPDVDYGHHGAPGIEQLQAGPRFHKVSGPAKRVHDKKVNSILAQVETLTKEQYVRRVGRRVAELELVERLDVLPKSRGVQTPGLAINKVRGVLGDIGMFRGWMTAFDEIFSVTH